MAEDHRNSELSGFCKHPRHGICLEQGCFIDYNDVSLIPLSPRHRGIPQFHEQQCTHNACGMRADLGGGKVNQSYTIRVNGILKIECVSAGAECFAQLLDARKPLEFAEIPAQRVVKIAAFIESVFLFDCFYQFRISADNRLADLQHIVLTLGNDGNTLKRCPSSQEGDGGFCKCTQPPLIPRSHIHFAGRVEQITEEFTQITDIPLLPNRIITVPDIERHRVIGISDSHNTDLMSIFLRNSSQDYVYRTSMWVEKRKSVSLLHCAEYHRSKQRGLAGACLPDNLVMPPEIKFSDSNISSASRCIICLSYYYRPFIFCIFMTGRDLFQFFFTELDPDHRLINFRLEGQDPGCIIRQHGCPVNGILPHVCRDPILHLSYESKFHSRDSFTQHCSEPYRRLTRNAQQHSHPHRSSDVILHIHIICVICAKDMFSAGILFLLRCRTDCDAQNASGLSKDPHHFREL